jgi:LDH2 family malate/lactate/ureidoglycolate dehydrogenase
MSQITHDNETHIFPAAYLRNFTAQVFMHFGVPRADAEQAADVLARSDLRGIDSHGVARQHT